MTNAIKEVAYFIETDINNGPSSGYFPKLKGCIFAGDTLDEAIEDAKSAIVAHFQCMADEGMELPNLDELKFNSDNEEMEALAENPDIGSGEGKMILSGHIDFDSSILWENGTLGNSEAHAQVSNHSTQATIEAALECKFTEKVQHEMNNPDSEIHVMQKYVRRTEV